MISSQVVGFLGTALAIAAYFPQIAHLVKEHCSAGVSQYAYSLWFLASLLLFIHAFVIGDKVFTLLMGFNTIAHAVILVYVSRYKNSLCASHSPAVGGIKRF